MRSDDEFHSCLRATSLPTLAEVLSLPEVTSGYPEVLAASQDLGAEVRWVHVSELSDIAGLLQGGELILTTGIALPQSAEGLRDYVQDLKGVNAVGLLVELGRRFTKVPTPLIRACERHRLPLVALHRPVKFVRITEAVHSRICHSQLAMLRFSDTVHQTFTRLSLEDASTNEIVSRVADLADSPVVLEDLLHRVLVCDPRGLPIDNLLLDWERRSRSTHTSFATEVAGEESWAVTPVVARGATFGRLVLLPTEPATGMQLMVLERGATALSLQHHQERPPGATDRRAKRSLLTDLAEYRLSSPRAIEARLKAFGLLTAGRTLVAAVVEGRTPRGRRNWVDTEHEVVRSVTTGLSRRGEQVVAGLLSDHRLGVLLSLSSANKRFDAARWLNERLSSSEHDLRIIVALGSPIGELAQIGRSFAEAHQVASSITFSTLPKPYYELGDVHLRGLLALLTDDQRVQAFAERTLGALLEHDAKHGSALFSTLSAYLAHGARKSATASACRVSRQTLYERLDQISRILGVELDEPETRTSLHAAVIAREAAVRDSPA
jgi:purine catabolism regulator